MALDLGFDLVGFAPLRPPRDAQRFFDWLDQGRHADMGWMERSRDTIGDPRRIRGEGLTILAVGMGHARPGVTLQGGGRVARYAAGRDYHNLMIKRLRRLSRELEREGLAGRSRAIVDAGPLLERSHAAEAGLGFASKAANLLHPTFGPWFFLGELLLDVEVEAVAQPPAGSCGTCTACIDACPTAAIVAPGEIDAGRCISYQTIENRAAIPHELRASHGEWVFGCDVCSEVCPWGHKAPDSSERWGTHGALETGTLERWLTWGEPEFQTSLIGSPLKRPKREGLARNAAIVLGNLPGDQGNAALSQALEGDASPVVRASAFWALLQGEELQPGIQARLGRALGSESDPLAAADMRQSLESKG